MGAPAERPHEFVISGRVGRASTEHAPAHSPGRAAPERKSRRNGSIRVVVFPGALWDGSALRTLDSEATLDFSASYQVTSNLGVRFQASNLTDEEVRTYYDNDENRLASETRFGRRFSLDATFRY